MARLVQLPIERGRRFGLAAFRGDTHQHRRCRRREDDCVVGQPRTAAWIGDRRDRDRRAAGDRDLLEPVLRKEGDPPAVWREERLIGVLCASDGRAVTSPRSRRTAPYAVLHDNVCETPAVLVNASDGAGASCSPPVTLDEARDSRGRWGRRRAVRHAEALSDQQNRQIAAIAVGSHTIQAAVRPRRSCGRPCFSSDGLIEVSARVADVPQPTPRSFSRQRAEDARYRRQRRRQATSPAPSGGSQQSSRRRPACNARRPVSIS